MDRQLFVQNIKLYCQLRGIKPTVACRESGAGPNLVNNVEAGSIPSVERVQLLAQYLGVTTSELLGETVDREDLSPLPDILVKFSGLSPDDQDEIMAIIEYKSNKNRR